MYSEPNFFQKRGPNSLTELAAVKTRQLLITYLNNRKLQRWHFNEFEIIREELQETFKMPKLLSLHILPDYFYPRYLKLTTDDPDSYFHIVFGELDFADLEFNGFNERLFSSDLFKSPVEVWLFLKDLTFRRNFLRMPEGSRVLELCNNLFTKFPLPQTGGLEDVD